MTQYHNCMKRQNFEYFTNPPIFAPSKKNPCTNHFFNNTYINQQ